MIQFCSVDYQNYKVVIRLSSIVMVSAIYHETLACTNFAIVDNLLSFQPDPVLQ